MREDAGDRPIRLALAMTTDSGYAVTRRFVLENVVTKQSGLVIDDGNDEGSNFFAPATVQTFVDADGLTLPAGQSLFYGIEMGFAETLNSEGTLALAWIPSYVPAGVTAYACVNDVCNRRLPAKQQPPWNGNTMTLSIKDGGRYDADQMADGHFSTKLVLLAPEPALTDNQ